MHSSLPDDRLVPLDEMLSGLSNAVQFSHWSVEDLRWQLNDLYESGRDARRYGGPTWEWYKKHEILREADAQGYISVRLFDARLTIAAVAEEEGSVCTLCHSWDDCAPVACADSVVPFESMLFLSNEGENIWCAPDPLCRLCRHHMSENLAKFYSRGMKKHEAQNQQLVELLSRPDFQERVRKNAGHSWRHRIDIKPLSDAPQYGYTKD